MSNAQSNTSTKKDPLSELSRLGLAYYETKLKPVLEPDQNNKFVAIHVDSGDYEVANTSAVATRTLLERRPPDGRIVIRKIGPEPEYELAGRLFAGVKRTDV